MKIEEILKEYFEKTNTNCQYKIIQTDTMPDAPTQTTPVVINGRHICFWETSDIDTNTFHVYWAFVGGDRFDYLKI